MDDIIIGDQLYITNEELVNYSSTVESLVVNMI